MVSYPLSMSVCPSQACTTLHPVHPVNMSVPNVKGDFLHTISYALTNTALLVSGKKMNTPLILNMIVTMPFLSVDGVVATSNGGEPYRHTFLEDIAKLCISGLLLQILISADLGRITWTWT